MLEGDGDDSSNDDLSNEVFSLKPQFQDTSSSDEHEPIPAETDETETEVVKPTKPAKSAKKSPKATSVLRAPSASSSDTEVQDESWGRDKAAYYSTNVADIDSDDEDTRQLENAEVLRLQAQAREALGEEDFGFLDPPRVNLTVGR
jgi:U3 small nucleolar RNA-associated protein 3